MGIIAVVAAVLSIEADGWMHGVCIGVAIVSAFVHLIWE